MSSWWISSRACLQVNYRGSTGYGKSFVAAGDREWGAKMPRAPMTPG
jgi:dipeptidyl aminopeptidase/acylaminoacyl peptidase